MSIKDAIRSVVEGNDLLEEEASSVMREIMDGEATPAQIAAFITALKMKGETVDEITGFARTMREKAEVISPSVEPLVDTCGTGGDGSGTFNISTAAALVTASAGIAVAKHGNRGVSSACGSADVLEGLGVRIDLPPHAVSACIEEVGIGFLFAPLFHKAMKHAVGPRREIGIRTVFNVLGPLTNPAGALYQIMGVYDPGLTEVMARVLRRLGSKRCLVVHGSGNIDEITTTGETRVTELREDGKVVTFHLSPSDFGLPMSRKGDLAGGSVERNVKIILGILGGENGPARDVVMANAGAALVVAGKAADFAEGARMAAEAVDSGAAMETLNRLRRFAERW